MMTNAQIASDYLRRLNQLTAGIDFADVHRTVQHLAEARDRGSKVYVAGNGGSAATAMHWANDLGKATKRSGRVPLRPICLADNISWITALANDEGFDRVFSGQLENFAEPGDVLVVISASGNSPNLVSAVEMARSREVRTIGFLGFDGGVLKDMVDDCIWVKTEKGCYELVEDAHMILCHILTSCLVQDRVDRMTAAVAQNEYNG